MAPIKKSTNQTSEKKRDKKVMTLESKIKVLDFLKSGERISSVAKKFVVNESTIRSIRQNEKKIRSSASKLEPYAKEVKISRRVLIEKWRTCLLFGFRISFIKIYLCVLKQFEIKH